MMEALSGTAPFSHLPPPVSIVDFSPGSRLTESFKRSPMSFRTLPDQSGVSLLQNSALSKSRAAPPRLPSHQQRLPSSPSQSTAGAKFSSRRSSDVTSSEFHFSDAGFTEPPGPFPVPSLTPGLSTQFDNDSDRVKGVRVSKSSDSSDSRTGRELSIYVPRVGDNGAASRSVEATLAITLKGGTPNGSEVLHAHAGSPSNLTACCETLRRLPPFGILPDGGKGSDATDGAASIQSMSNHGSGQFVKGDCGGAEAAPLEDRIDARDEADVVGDFARTSAGLAGGTSKASEGGSSKGVILVGNPSDKERPLAEGSFNGGHPGENPPIADSFRQERLPSNSKGENFRPSGDDVKRKALVPSVVAEEARGGPPNNVLQDGGLVEAGAVAGESGGNNEAVLGHDTMKVAESADARLLEAAAELALAFGTTSMAVEERSRERVAVPPTPLGSGAAGQIASHFPNRDQWNRSPSHDTPQSDMLITATKTQQSFDSVGKGKNFSEKVDNPIGDTVEEAAEDTFHYCRDSKVNVGFVARDSDAGQKRSSESTPFVSGVASQETEGAGAGANRGCRDSASVSDVGMQDSEMPAGADNVVATSPQVGGGTVVLPGCTSVCDSDRLQKSNSHNKVGGVSTTLTGRIAPILQQQQQQIRRTPSSSISSHTPCIRPSPLVLEMERLAGLLSQLRDALPHCFPEICYRWHWLRIINAKSVDDLGPYQVILSKVAGVGLGVSAAPSRGFSSGSEGGWRGGKSDATLSHQNSNLGLYMKPRDGSRILLDLEFFFLSMCKSEERAAYLDIVSASSVGHGLAEAIFPAFHSPDLSMRNQNSSGLGVTLSGSHGGADLKRGMSAKPHPSRQIPTSEDTLYSVASKIGLHNDAVNANNNELETNLEAAISRVLSAVTNNTSKMSSNSNNIFSVSSDTNYDNLSSSRARPLQQQQHMLRSTIPATAVLEQALSVPPLQSALPSSSRLFDSLQSLSYWDPSDKAENARTAAVLAHLVGSGSTTDIGQTAADLPQLERGAIGLLSSSSRARGTAVQHGVDKVQDGDNGSGFDSNSTTDDIKNHSSSAINAMKELIYHNAHFQPLSPPQSNSRSCGPGQYLDQQQQASLSAPGNSGGKKGNKSKKSNAKLWPIKGAPTKSSPEMTMPQTLPHSEKGHVNSLHQSDGTAPVASNAPKGFIQLPLPATQSVNHLENVNRVVGWGVVSQQNDDSQLLESASPTSTSLAATSSASYSSSTAGTSVSNVNAPGAPSILHVGRESLGEGKQQGEISSPSLNGREEGPGSSSDGGEDRLPSLAMSETGETGRNNEQSNTKKDFRSTVEGASPNASHRSMKGGPSGGVKVKSKGKASNGVTSLLMSFSPLAIPKGAGRTSVVAFPNHDSNLSSSQGPSSIMTHHQHQLLQQLSKRETHTAPGVAGSSMAPMTMRKGPVGIAGMGQRKRPLAVLQSAVNSGGEGVGSPYIAAATGADSRVKGPLQSGTVVKHRRNSYEVQDDGPGDGPAHPLRLSGQLVQSQRYVFDPRNLLPSGGVVGSTGGAVTGSGGSVLGSSSAPSTRGDLAVNGGGQFRPDLTANEGLKVEAKYTGLSNEGSAANDSGNSREALRDDWPGDAVGSELGKAGIESPNTQKQSQVPPERLLRRLNQDTAIRELGGDNQVKVQSAEGQAEAGGASLGCRKFAEQSSDSQASPCASHPSLLLPETLEQLSLRASESLAERAVRRKLWSLSPARLPVLGSVNVEYLAMLYVMHSANL